MAYIPCFFMVSRQQTLNTHHSYGCWGHTCVVWHNVSVTVERSVSIFPTELCCVDGQSRQVQLRPRLRHRPDLRWRPVQPAAVRAGLPERRLQFGSGDAGHVTQPNSQVIRKYVWLVIRKWSAVLGSRLSVPAIVRLRKINWVLLTLARPGGWYNPTWCFFEDDVKRAALRAAKFGIAYGAAFL